MAAQAFAESEGLDFGDEKAQDSELTLTVGDETIVIEPDKVFMDMIRPLPGMLTGRFPDKDFTQQRFITVYA